MPELLSPAGSPEALRAAVENGAGAVYLGLGGFNARRSAKNFTWDDLAAAIPWCHERGARIFLTLNTLLSDRELPEALEMAERAAALAECVEGAVMEGTVDSLTDYGAFVKLAGGVSGLLHVSQISHERVAKPSDVLNKGDKITVKIIAVKDGKISLSKKALEEAPARKERAPRADRPERENREGREGRDGERRPRERREKEEVFNYKETGKATTSLGDILNNIKLN